MIYGGIEKHIKVETKVAENIFQSSPKSEISFWLKNVAKNYCKIYNRLLDAWKIALFAVEV